MPQEHADLGLMDMRDPVDVEIFADEIDANVAARAFNRAYLSGARSAVVARDPRGWVVRVYQYGPVGYLAPKIEAAVIS
jgi:DNA-binding NarL/FixJ family response regulator